jgi:hypothetical protein
MRKVSGDLTAGGRYAESFGLSTRIGTICGNFLSNKIVSLLFLLIILHCFDRCVPMGDRTNHKRSNFVRLV